jgi:MFS transporter, FHS family, L-fucose permease
MSGVQQDVTVGQQSMENSMSNSSSKSGSLVLAIVYITSLFFIWAFVTNLIDPLVKSMKVIYTLSDAEAQLTQLAFFIAYGVMSIPSAAYLAKKGYANSIILGLSGIVAGCLIAWATTFTNGFRRAKISHQTHRPHKHPVS